MTHPRATGIDANRYPTEAHARTWLTDGDQDLEYLGIWRTQHGDRLHMFVRDITADEYQARGWTREATRADQLAAEEDPNG